ncbi:hypothetical protein HNP86_001997 [Methanococcus maripaludis]|uniref:Uncharacterized protein n=1 Tax=Methanococcus maripaludis TaxID=39152 RepID=A0A7J9NVX0_METMI|nr:hypothetical protein [Methanococcus maripaludis]MBA2851838.1 hypothetical protein [Methanococcus maripaludis]
MTITTKVAKGFLDIYFRGKSLEELHETMSRVSKIDVHAPKLAKLDEINQILHIEFDESQPFMFRPSVGYALKTLGYTTKGLLQIRREPSKALKGYLYDVEYVYLNADVCVYTYPQGVTESEFYGVYNQFSGQYDVEGSLLLHGVSEDAVDKFSRAFAGSGSTCFIENIPWHGSCDLYRSIKFGSRYDTKTISRITRACVQLLKDSDNDKGTINIQASSPINFSIYTSNTPDDTSLTIKHGLYLNFVYMPGITVLGE